MSHLLYLHSFAVDRFCAVFGGGNAQHLEALLKIVPVNAAVTPARATELVTNAVMHGLDGAALPAPEQALLDVIVDFALTRNSFGIRTTPISPMGVGGPLFDAFAERFSDAKATRLFAVLQRGRSYDGSFLVLSPDDVALAATQLKKIADRLDPDDADELDAVFMEELVEPFVKTATKKDRAIFGQWN
jgi:hypothetical protein